MAVSFDRYPRDRPLRRRPVLARSAPLWRRPGREGTFDADAGAAAGEGGPARSRCPNELPDRHLAFDGTVVVGRADGRQPRHRLCARRGLRRAAWLYFLRDAAGGDALEQVRQRGTAGDGLGGDGTSRRGRRRRAGLVHPRPRPAAQPAGCADRPGAFRPHRTSRRWRRPGFCATRARSTSPAQVREILVLAA